MPDLLIIDDGNAGTTETGDWRISGGADPYGTQSLYSKKVGAEYAFESNIAGTYEVSLWWTGYSSRCSDVPVEIFDGNTLLDIILVDQTQNSGQWYSIGLYVFSKGSKVIISSDSKDCSTSADAAKFQKQ